MNSTFLGNNSRINFQYVMNSSSSVQKEGMLSGRYLFSKPTLQDENLLHNEISILLVNYIELKHNVVSEK